MSFISTGLRELTLKVRRQRTRLALRHEEHALKKSEIALGREGTSEAANFPEVRAEIVALKKLEQEQKEFEVRIAKIEEALKQIEQQREENKREQKTALAKLEEEKQPVLERQHEAKVVADRCAEELATVDRRIAANDSTDHALLKQLAVLESTDPPPADREAQRERIAAERARLPGEKAEMVQARVGRDEASRAAREKLAAQDALVAQADKNIAKVRGEFEARDKTLQESSRARQEEIREARQQYQTVEEKKNPAYLNIGRHLADSGTAPPNAPHLLADVQRHRATVERHSAHTRELAEISAQIDKQELRKFYFAIVSILVLLAIVVPLALQSPAARDWLPQDTVAVLSVEPGALAKTGFVQRWRKEQPELWPQVFAGLVGSAARTPALDLAKDASRVTRALASDADGQLRDYVLVETRSDIGSVLGAVSRDQSFDKSTVSGLAVWNRPDVAIARVGPKTLAVGSLGEVDRLVQVRLGTEPDLKVDDPLAKEFQALEEKSTIRFATRHPADLPRFFGPIFPTEFLAAAQLLGLAVVVEIPAQAHLFVRATDKAVAQELAAGLKNEFSRWLTLPGSDFVLATQTPKVDQNGTDLDLHFQIPEGAARLLLQRLARIQPSPAPSP